MLAAVFLMQPIGQFLAYIVGYGALRGITKDRLPTWTSVDWDNEANHDEGAATIVSIILYGESFSLKSNRLIRPVVIRMLYGVASLVLGLFQH
jgi:hypothetical protein